jgi:hypothetical protein
MPVGWGGGQESPPSGGAEGNGFLGSGIGFKFNVC